MTTDTALETGAEAGPATGPASLSHAMREGSQAQHDAAESSVFVEELMAGRVSAAGYVNYLRCLHPVYVALAEVGRALADDPLVSRVHDPRLDRADAIAADIADWGTGAPEETLCAGEAAAAYADRIRATEHSPARFVAHHYTRFLGDLSGGQAIGRVLDREFQLGGRGTALYRFEEIGKVKPYKDGYRARLDALPLSAPERAEVVSEVQAAFGHNQAIFVELARDLPAYARG